MKAALYEKYYTTTDVKAKPNDIFLFGDNFTDSITNYKPKYTQAVIRGLPNAIGICTKNNRQTNIKSYLSDEQFDSFKEHVDSQLQKAIDYVEATGGTIYIPKDGIGTGKAELYKRAPKLQNYLNKQLNNLLNKRVFSTSDKSSSTKRNF